MAPANPLRDTGQLGLMFQPERVVFQVSELSNSIQRLFQANYRNIYVAGEISGCRPASSGHYYFSLKDDTSQLKCALFKMQARFLKFKPQDGLAVIARGSLEVYEQRGELQLVVETLEPQGAGALQLAYEQLKKKLTAEGLFELGRKRALPKLPRRIGIVTSKDGAVIRDILHVLDRRFPGLHIRLFPALVQGTGSNEQVCRGIRFFSDCPWADVVIVARGGGSLEDLWTFNEEAVVRAIAASVVPTISAVGHETDFTLADFVADHRAPTPSAAAEVVICTRESLFEQLVGCRAKLVQSLRYRLLLASRNLEQRGTERAHSFVQRALKRRFQSVDELDERLYGVSRSLLNVSSRKLIGLMRRLEATDLRRRFAQGHTKLMDLQSRLTKALQTRVWQAKRKQETAVAHLKQLSPLAVLDRGYAIVQTPDGSILRLAADTAAGEPLRVRLAQGELDATVQATRDT